MYAACYDAKFLRGLMSANMVFAVKQIGQISQYIVKNFVESHFIASSIPSQKA
jgi:hypothetical protein